MVGKWTADPATVEIVGPDSHVRQVAEATTEPVSVKDARARVRDGVTIGVVDSSVRLTQAQSANVTVEIWPAPVERRMSDVPVRWRNLGTGLSAQISPQLVHVTVRGSNRSRSRRCAATVPRRSWTLPGSVRAGTISGFRWTPRRPSGSWPSIRPSYR